MSVVGINPFKPNLSLSASENLPNRFIRSALAGGGRQFFFTEAETRSRWLCIALHITVYFLIHYTN
jgi:hypothetical protein